MTTSRRLARNSALNLIGQITPIAVALLTIPLLVRGYGVERFGVLALAQAAIGYFSLFELGLGRALTQSVAQRLGNGGDRELPAVARTGLVMLLVLGVAAGLLLASLTPALTIRILRIPAALQEETKVVFFIMAATLPFVLGTTGLRGIIEAHQHFGLSTALRLPAGLVTYVGPLVVLPFSRSLVPAVAVIAAGRLATFLAHVILCRRRYPYLSERAVATRESLRALLRFGAWMTVSNAVSPLLVYLDRFVIGALISLEAVTAYVTPYEAVAKLLIIPGALTGAFMPALASTLATQPERLTALYEKSSRAVLLVIFPLVLAAVVLAHEALGFWVGGVLPAESATVMQWLALGVFFTAVAFTPMTALHSAGRPDLLAKLHLVELPVYAAGMLLFMRAFGLKGIAMAWTLRALLDAVAVAWLARHTLHVPALPRLGGSWSLALMVAAMAAGAALSSTAVRIAFTAVVILTFVPLAWYRLLTSTERRGLLDMLRGTPLASAPSSADA